MSKEKSILLKKATIIDGTGKPPYMGSVVIKGNKIEQIISGDNPSESEVDEVIDASGLFLLPGIIDCHVHTMLNGFDWANHLMTPFSLKFYEAIDNFKILLHTGITSARDAGGADLGVKKALEKALIEGPKLKISITPLTTTGGHFDAYVPAGFELSLLNPPYPGNPSGICDGSNEIVKKVREVLRSGADVIKVCSTGGVMGPNDDPEFTQFTVDELKIMVQEGAMRKGVKVMAHAQGLEGIKNAVKAGAHSIEHGIYLDDEAIALMLEHDVFLVPTLLAMQSVLDGDYPQDAKDKAKKIIEEHKKSIAKAHKAGVKIAMGTDSGVMKHGRNLEELRLMCEVGMSPMESIVAATQTAAQCLEIDAITGTIEEDKRADLLLVKKNPLEDISSLAQSKNINSVIQEGRIVKQQI